MIVMRVKLFGCPIDILSMDETVDLVRTAVRRREQLHHVAINAAKLVNLQANSELAEDIKRSHIVGIDGMSIVLALRAFGWRNPERVAGIDLMDEVLGMCAKEGFRPFFLGAKPAIVVKASSKACEKYPELEFAGIRDGYFSEAEEADVVEQIRASGADCLFVGIPTPYKERFLAKNAEALGVPFIMGVGGSFDVWAGFVKRAPVAMQRFGMEWLYRTYQEPRRMWWRYTRTNSIFAAMLLYGVIRSRLLGLAATEPKAPTS